MLNTFSLRCHLDDSGLLHFDFVDDVFVHEVLRLLRVSAVSGTGSATMFVAKACHGHLGLVVVFWSCAVVSREAFVGPPTDFLRGGTGVP